MSRKFIFRPSGAAAIETDGESQGLAPLANAMCKFFALTSVQKTASSRRVGAVWEFWGDMTFVHQWFI